MVNGSPWTDKEAIILRQKYCDRPTREIAMELGRTTRSVYNAANKMGLKKSPEFLAGELSGMLRKGETRPGSVASQFRKGNVPYNAGTRRPGWAPGRMGETQFKKGQTRRGTAATNWKPIGTLLTDPEGYLRIKVREAVHGAEAYGFGNTKVWPLLQRHAWEQHNGPIPPGHVICFKDGKRDNCAIDNLELVSRADLARRNSMWNRLPREIAEVIQLRGALNRKIRRLSNAKKQD